MPNGPIKIKTDAEKHETALRKCAISVKRGKMNMQVAPEEEEEENLKGLCQLYLATP